MCFMAANTMERVITVSRCERWWAQIMRFYSEMQITRITVNDINDQVCFWLLQYCIVAQRANNANVTNVCCAVCLVPHCLILDNRMLPWVGNNICCRDRLFRAVTHNINIKAEPWWTILNPIAFSDPVLGLYVVRDSHTWIGLLPWLRYWGTFWLG